MRQFVQFVIIGSGPIGVATAHQLVTTGGVHPSDIILVDTKAPLRQFEANALHIGQTSMRSPWEANVAGVGAPEMHALAKTWMYDTNSIVPPVGLFVRHGAQVLRDTNVMHMRGTVTALQRWGYTWEVQLRHAGTTQIETLSTRNVIVACGMGPHRRERLAGTVSVPGTSIHSLPRGRIAVIGGGLTATTVALKMIANGAHVTMFAPGGLRVAMRDAPSYWFPTPMPGDSATFTAPSWCNGCEDSKDLWSQFATLPLGQRMEILRQDTLSGTTTPQQAEAVVQAVRNGQCTFAAERVLACPNGFAVVTELRTHFGFDPIIDARGYQPRLSDLRGIVGLVGAASQTFDTLPIVDRTMQAAPGLFFAGAMAGLQIGPTAHTVAGGLRAARAIAEHAHATL